MRILHTSDWHLGALLENVSREPDHQQFLDWLADVIPAEGIDVLVVAGDLFDGQTPSAEAQGLYYRFLHRLKDSKLRQVVVVGGNHDSPSRLDAPKELLSAFGIHVVGGLSGPGDLERCLCPVKDAGGTVVAVVVAVPFVNEWRLGFRPGEADAATRTELLGDPFKRLYACAADLAEAQWPGVPLIATGHLAALGSEKDDAPLEIHLIGSIGGLPTSIFDPRFAYVALGHIHRGYRVGGTQAWYCGTPVALNVKEGRSPRRVNLVDLAPDGVLTVTPLPVPQTRQVLAFSGSLEQVKAELSALVWTEPLPPLVKVEVTVASRTLGIEEEIRLLVEGLNPRPILVAIIQTLVRPLPQGGTVEAVPPRLADLTPREVFKLLCVAKEENYDELISSFEAVLTLVENP